MKTETVEEMLERANEMFAVQQQLECLGQSVPANNDRIVMVYTTANVCARLERIAEALELVAARQPWRAEGDEG